MLFNVQLISLQFLSYADLRVREFAIHELKHLSDSELLDFLTHLVQVSSCISLHFVTSLCYLTLSPHFVTSLCYLTYYFISHFTSHLISFFTYYLISHFTSHLISFLNYDLISHLISSLNYDLISHFTSHIISF